MPRPGKGLKTYKYNGGIIRETRYGTFQAEYNVRGKRLRETMKTLAAAKHRLEEVAMAIETQTRPLSTLEIDQARQAFNELPAGVTLPEVVRFWTSRHKTVQESCLVQDAVDQYIAAKERRGLRRESIRTPRNRLNRLAQALPDRMLHEITLNHLLEVLEDFGVEGQTWNNYRADWSAFWTWAVGRELAADNPAKRIESHATYEGIREFLPQTTIRNMLGMIERHDPELAPYYYLSFFLGIRTTELHRMAGALVTPELVRVTPESAKTGAMRHLEPHETVRAWIERYPPPDGPIVVRNHRNRSDAIRRRLGYPHWPVNGGRHAAATYLLAAWQDAGRVAYTLGHRNTNLLYNRYRGLTTPEEAEQYLAILPGKPMV